MAARNLVYSLNRKQESGREWNRRLAVAFPEVLQPFRCVSHPSRYMVLTIPGVATLRREDRKSTRLNSSHGYISYAVFCLKKKKPTSRCRTQLQMPPNYCIIPAPA